jgi:receptor expression-enhancing protein 5/6
MKSEKEDINAKKENNEKSSYSKIKIFIKEIDLRFKILNIITIIIYSFAFLCIFFGCFKNFFSNLIGIFHPLINSINCLEKGNSDKDNKCLRYWIVFCLFYTFEMFISIFIYRSKYYYLIKCVFFIFLYYPNLEIYDIIYKSIIRNIFKLKEKEIGNILFNFKKDLKSINKNLQDKFVKHTQEITLMQIKILERDNQIEEKYHK